MMKNTFQTAVCGALVIAAVTSCGRTDLASPSSAQRVSAQGQPITNTYTSTGELDFISPCNGERVNGTTTSLIQEQVVSDGAGGVHVQLKLSVSSTFKGDTTNMTYTETGQAHIHINELSSGAYNEVVVLNSTITADDGTIIRAKDRFVLVKDANGIRRVLRTPSDAGSLTCRSAR